MRSTPAWHYRQLAIAHLAISSIANSQLTHFFAHRRRLFFKVNGHAATDWRIGEPGEISVLSANPSAVMKGLRKGTLASGADGFIGQRCLPVTEGSGQGMVEQVLVIRVYGLVGQLLKIAGVEVISSNWVHFLWRE